MSRQLLALCYLLLVVGDVARGATLVAHLGAAFGTETRDTMIFQNNVDNGAGDAPGFFAGSNSQPSPRRGVISFDVSSIPSHATITSVELRLVIGQLAGSGGGTNPPGTMDPVIGLHKMLVSWGEADTGQSTASVLNGTGQGTQALDGDSTWNARFYDDANPVNWSQPGGQLGVEVATPLSASLVQPNERYVESIWQSTPQLVADVQSWLNNPSLNFGWMLINTNEVDRQTFRGFFSHDYNPASLPTDLPVESELDEAADFWPVLTVAYEIPVIGDFNGDGDVDGRDFLAWQRGESPNPLSSGDLAAWQLAYDADEHLSIMMVPEPSSVLLLLPALGIMIKRRGYNL